MRVSIEMAAKQEDWNNAAISASNLSELEVTLGRLGDAVDDARRAIDFADRSGDTFQRMGIRTTAADALHQSGQPGERDEARAFFEAAEALQRERQPQFDLLYSLPGFRYCDLILALDHLTLARVALYRAALSAQPPAADANPHLAPALDGLRKAGHSDYLPNALLTAAHWHALLGDAATARCHLDEAQQIAERGPMPLYLADIHLHRARFAGSMKYEGGSQTDEVAGRRSQGGTRQSQSTDRKTPLRPPLPGTRRRRSYVLTSNHWFVRTAFP